MSHSLPYRRQIAGPKLFVAAVLLALLLAMVAVAVLGGAGGADIFRTYAEWLKELP